MWKEYIRREGVAVIAEQVGVTRQCVYNWLNDVGTPNDDAKRKLVEVAEGELSIMDFFRKEVQQC